MRIGRRMILGGALALPALGARAQGEWPARPVRLVVAYPPGGSTDIVARLLAERLARAWGQPVIVENRAGASGTLGADAVAKAAPDGYTLLLGASSEMAIARVTFRSLPYDAARDFTPVARTSEQPFLLLVNAALPATSVAELVALAKARPGALNYASFGNGTSTHLMGELLRVSTGIEIAHVPYRGSAPGIADLIAGQVQMSFDTVPAGTPHIGPGGRLRALAFTHTSRSAAAPQVPTTTEVGFPQLVGSTWSALVAPAGTPEPVLRRIGADVARAKAEGFNAALVERGIEPVAASSPEEARTFFAAEYAKWSDVAQRAGVRPE
ncbi:MAG: tripartite tricarboxylate transporter substrate binding protein [Acetobacteraceae bacterium]|nr:tripartite tricarboxylate transporter substrate binding protein [Acetobacteraceae bacterium]